MTRLVLISDTHGLHDQIDVPDGDILIHAGDLTMEGKLADLPAFNRWFSALPHPHKIIIAGNHDFCFERQPVEAQAHLTGCHYLENSSVEIAGISFYGSPFQPWFFDWAFQRQRGAPMRAIWEQIPTGIDVLITHGPPHGIGDMTLRGAHAGCEELRLALDRVQPRLHVFGHIHESAGLYHHHHTTCVNASNCGFPDYRQMQQPILFDW